ncbi:MAG: SpoIIE family protein phosphatase [Amphritea sp.]|nr:SpoIIE family protein phosphatase [Amphritea sp.]
MLKRLAEWHLQPELIEARRIREALTEVLQAENAPGIESFQLACAELIVNLYRYPDPRPTDVVLSLSKDEQYWWLELKDNGPSFNDFSRLINSDDPLEAAESGMGLKLLAQMFQDIRYVPACYRQDAYNLMLLRQPVDTGSELQKTLLLVDDDPSYRAVIAAYLKDHYQVVQADSVQQGFDEVLRYQPDLVICDIQMPEHDGPVLFDQLSHIPDVADTAFIYLSGCSEPDKISQALSRPIDDFLAKPVSREQLIGCIERVIQRRSYLQQQIRHELEQQASLGLQPNLPAQIPGYSVQLRSLNPEPGGGDLVQLQKQDSQSMILMADLMGHGLAAKGYAYALAGYLRGLTSAISNQQAELTGLFALLSEGFEQDPLLKETLATLIAVRLSADGELEWVNAGQPYPLLMTDKGTERIEVEGVLPGLGVEHYEMLSLVVESGQRILIYSDGFQDAAEPFSDAMSQAITASQSMPLAAAADHLLMARLQARQTEDDLTLILIEKD